MIKNYKVNKELGRGGMAAVFLAHDNKFDTSVAIKLLNKEFMYNDNIRKRFLAEARSMFKMSHPNIIKVTDLIEEDDTVAFVMEYIEGETLKDYIDRKGKLSDEEIKNIFTQMLSAVGYVHEQNLVHRDIKPSNFMLDKKGSIKLMDFGIAKTTDISSAEYTQTGTGVQMGTPMYMSPEQIKNSKEVSYTTDIYSLGVVLWQMVMGKKPYNTNELSLPEIQVCIIKENLPNTFSAFDYIIQKATQKNPEQRYVNCKVWLSEISNPALVNSSTGDKTILENEASEDAKQVEGQLKNEEKNQKITQAKKNNLTLVFVISGIILFVILTYVLSNKASSPEPYLPHVDSAMIDDFSGEPIPEIGNSIIYTVRLSPYGEYKDNKCAVPIAVYLDGKFIEPPHCYFGENNQNALDECERSKELLLTSVQPGTILFEIDNGKQTNSISVTGTENFGYSDWTLFSGRISNKVSPSILTDNHKIGTNRLGSIKNMPESQKDRKLIGIADIDGDGKSELIYECQEYEGESYQIFSHLNGEWKVVYSGGYQGV